MGSSHSITVLHVEDEPDLADVVATYLQRENERLTVETATSAQEGLDRLSENEIDCVVSDYDMPGQNGLDFLQTVRKTDPTLPFILYTGKGSEEIASEAISAGVTDYLQKESGTDQYTILANRIRNAVERNRAEFEADQTRIQLQAIANNSGDAILMIDSESRIRFANPVVEDYFGSTPAELQGEPLTTIMPERHHDEHLAAIDQYLETGERSLNWSDVVFPGLHKDGTEIPLSISFSEFEQDGERRFIAIMRDMSERIELEKQREQIIERVTDAIVEVDADWRFTLVNEQAEALYDMAEDDLLGRDFWDVFEEAKDTRFEEEYREVMETREPTSFVEFFSQLDGWFDIEAYPKQDGGISFYFIDVTEQREREQELEQERAFISTALDTLDDLFFVVGTDGGLERWNKRASEATGYSEAELAEMDAIEFFPETERTRIANAIETTLETGSARVEANLLSADGTHIPYEFAARRLITSEGAILGIAGIGRDISERKEREQELARQRALLDAQQESILDGILVVNENNEMISYNDRFIELWNVPEDVIAEQDEATALEYATDQLVDPEEFHETVEYLYDNPEETSRDEIELTDGRVFDRYTTPLHGEDGTYYGRLWTFRDITERIEQEEKLRQQNERLEEFASIVSHDLRNPLNVAQGRVELAQVECESEHLYAAELAHERTFALIGDLLTLAREGESVTDIEPVDIATVMTRCWQNVETGDATLATSTARTIRADRSRLEQLLENLIRNAVEHGGEDVTVTIGELDDGFYVEDDGPGIPEDDRGKVFDAGYSTAEEGTGFGLTIVKQVADAHGWNIGVSKGSDGGGRFEITAVEFVPA